MKLRSWCLVRAVYTAIFAGCLSVASAMEAQGQAWRRHTIDDSCRQRRRRGGQHQSHRYHGLFHCLSLI
jgi:hypothetical protein